MTPIPRLCIVGVGLIGGSIGLAAKVRGVAEHVVGVDPNADTWVDALRIGAVDELTNDVELGVRNADLVVLAMPVEAILDLLPRLAPLLHPHAVVIDTGSVKGNILKTAKNAAPLAFIGTHPMAGSEKAGAAYSRADLFQDATWAIVTPTNDLGEDVEYVTDFVTALGSKPLYISATAHDEAVALTSHLPHVLAYTLCAMLAGSSSKERERFLALSAGSWKSATRVAESSPELWSEIASQNAVPLVAALRTFAAELNTVATALENGDKQTVVERFTAGHAAKRG